MAESERLGAVTPPRVRLATSGPLPLFWTYSASSAPSRGHDSRTPRASNTQRASRRRADLPGPPAHSPLPDLNPW